MNRAPDFGVGRAMAGAALLALLFGAPNALSANPSFSVTIAPPAAIVETPPPPAPGRIWEPGYWSWNGATYVWVPGHYAVAPYPGAVWVAGRWVPHGPRWMWADGHWRHR
jgi:hypothetical protein